ncbi:MAG: peptidogalycan biosysnthesis protein, partial [Sphingobium sp.]
MTEVVARIGKGVADLPKAEWDACAGYSNPFISWDFLVALERSGSVGGDSGWQPLPIVIEGRDGRIAAAAPAYGKSHSQGEYVFDHGWADAWVRAGGRYYPKIQVAAPFSPVPGPRLLLRDADAAPALIAGIETLVERNGLSSAHATFIDPEQVPL